MTRTKNTESIITPVDEKVDHGANLSAAFVTYLADDNMADLLATYRAIPGAARGKAQNVAIPAAIVAGMDTEKLSAILTAFTNLPVTTARVTRRDLTDDEVATIRRHAVDVYRGVDTPDTVESLIADGFADVVNTAVDRIAKACDGVDIGARTRTVNSTTMADLISDGKLTAGQELSGPSGSVATVNADGTVNVNGVTFDSLSAAARSVTGHSVNGWAAFTANGVNVGTLRH